MWIILCRLIEEIIPVCQMMFTGRRCCRERWLNALRIIHGQRSIHLIRRDMIKAFALVPLR